MISKDKQYRTRDGREVRIYATDHDDEQPIVGAMRDYDDGGWRIETWFNDGSYMSDRIYRHDLIEVKPRIKREYWVNVDGKGSIQSWHQEKDALEDFRVPTTKACVKVVIDCEEGEGL